MSETFSLTPGTEPQGFERFWAAWPKHPRKRAKSKCGALWTQHHLEAKAEHVLAVLERDKASEMWTKQQGQFIPAPVVWLRGMRWQVELADLGEKPVEKLTAPERIRRLMGS